MALNPSIQFNFRSRQLPLRSARPEGRARRHFLSVPHSWGTRDLANLTAICNLQCEYDNIFIKVLQGHPGKNQTTTREESGGALEHPSAARFSWPPLLAVRRTQAALGQEPAGGSWGGSTWSKEDIHSGSAGPGARGGPAGEGMEADAWSCLPPDALPPPSILLGDDAILSLACLTSGSAKGALL